MFYGSEPENVLKIESIITLFWKKDYMLPYNFYAFFDNSEYISIDKKNEENIFQLFEQLKTYLLKSQTYIINFIASQFLYIKSIRATRCNYF